MDFTAIDFETANHHKTSACSIGITEVTGGKIQKTSHYFIRPYPDYFSNSNIAVHGIYAQDVEDAPTFDRLWPVIREKLDGRIVAAHFAAFDMGVLTAALDHYAIPYPQMDVLCSCLMARAAYPQLANHKLNNVCTYLDIPLDHHRADSDAAGSAGIINRIMADCRLNSLEEIASQLGVKPGRMQDGLYEAPRGRNAGGRRRSRKWAEQ